MHPCAVSRIVTDRVDAQRIAGGGLIEAGEGAVRAKLGRSRAEGYLVAIHASESRLLDKVLCRLLLRPYPGGDGYRVRDIEAGAVRCERIVDTACSSVDGERMGADPARRHTRGIVYEPRVVVVTGSVIDLRGPAEVHRPVAGEDGRR